MFSTSTQAKQWMFTSEEELEQLRAEANHRFIGERRADFDAQNYDYDEFLSPAEEALLTKHYETILRDFCRKFQPPMPRCVVGTAFQYYKRFYLNNSVMDFHPKHIVVTCVYMAAKVEEFNVSMAQFVANVRGDREKASAIVLNNELFLMQQLKYHLIVHNPLRAIEGFLIDLKTRFPQCGDPERLRPHIDHFIDLTFSTNACFLFSPSQIALSAVVYGASKIRIDLDRYLTGLLFFDRDNEVQYLREVMSTLWTMINSEAPPPKEKVKQIEKKLEKCRNQSNNPDSNEYKRSLDEEMAEESAVALEKYSKICEEQERNDRKLIESSATSSRRSKRMEID